MDRTHNQSSPQLVPWHQLSTEMRVQYQSEEIVNLRFAAGWRSHPKRAAKREL